jgi:hypothetical protein
MDNSKRVQMLNPQDNFSYIIFGNILGKVDLFFEEFSKISALHIFKKKEMNSPFSERKGSFNKMLPCNFLQDFVLIH